jgi:hypothetical protein
MEAGRELESQQQHVKEESCLLMAQINFEVAVHDVLAKVGRYVVLF